jgi:hypothetical protein
MKRATLSPNPFLYRLMRLGFRKGMSSGSRTWFVLGISAGTLQVLRRLSRDRTQILYRAKLQDGDHFVVTSRKPQ